MGLWDFDSGMVTANSGLPTVVARRMIGRVAGGRRGLRDLSDCPSKFKSTVRRRPGGVGRWTKGRPCLPLPRYLSDHWFTVSTSASYLRQDRTGALVRAAHHNTHSYATRAYSKWISSCKVILLIWKLYFILHYNYHYPILLKL